ncbi:MAG: ABC transporter ATP-binding protein [Planctomycetota bacterium]
MRWTHKYLMLWRQMAGQRLRYTAALVALAFAIGLTFLVPLVIGVTIDHGLGGEPIDDAWLAVIVSAETLRDGLWWIGLLVVGLTVFASFFMFVEGALANQASESIVRRLRDRLFDRLQHLTCAYHDQAEAGDLVQKCTSDVDTTRAFLATQVIEIVRAMANLFIALPVLFWLDWRLALFSTCVLPIIVSFALVFFRVVQFTFKNMDEAEGALTARLQENLTNIRVVRAFARQAFEQEKFDTRNTDHRAKHWTLYRVFAVYWSVSDFLVFVQMGLALFAGAAFVASGKMPVGELVTFWLYVGLMVWPVRQMGRTLSELGKALVALQRIDEVLSAPMERDAAGPPVSLPDRLTGRIALRGVRFGHQDGQAILDGLSFEVEPGQTLALLGPSGSGKSTIVNLLLRFYDADSGAIEIDGHDLGRLPRKYVRSQIGAVMQEPFLYSKTLRDNLKLGRHEAPDEDMIDVANSAAVHDAIERFDEGYDTMVGERGVTLSGGQRQRVAIARALLQDKPVMILDDAFSAVDTKTEAMIVNFLRRRRGRATTILIAHRLSTLMHADRILVLEHGRVTQQGTHDQLLKAEGLYCRLWHIQTALEDDLKQKMTAV